MTFQFDYSIKAHVHKITMPQEQSKIKGYNIVDTMGLHWEEHCVECAMPECYNVCPLFVRRMDGACARFKYGIQKNDSFHSTNQFGAEIHFRKWAKLEACLGSAIGSETVEEFDEFVLECYSLIDEAFNLLIEYFTETERFRTTRFKCAISLVPGYNFFSIPYSSFNIERGTGYLYVSPEKSMPEKKIVFSFIDFVSLALPAVPTIKRASLVKCVAWDLDNTLWDGIVSENDAVLLRPESESIVKELDRRGILQTIVSKNDFEPTMIKLKELNIDKYFLYPLINWGQKSENLKRIANKLNIDLNSFAFIDDSAFERADISLHLPQVRVYSDTDMGILTTLPEFNSPVTAMSAERRQSYLTEQQRNADAVLFSDNYDNFLRQCQMLVRLFIPERTSDVLRCWELIQRTNQLNLSSERYAIDEFRKLIKNESHVPIGIRCRDRYGDYGIVGFILLDMGGVNPRFKDFVLSCRVAQKKIEHTTIQAITQLLLKNRIYSIETLLVRTEKNGPLCKVFSDLEFVTQSVVEKKEIMSNEISRIPKIQNLMKLNISDQVSKKIKSLARSFLKST